MRRLYQCAVIAALLLGVAPFTAEAQTMALPNGLYLGVDVGAIVPQSISVHSTSSGVSFNGDLDFDTGVATGITLGHHVTPVVAVEGNFEYAGFDLHSLSGTVSVSGVGSASGSVGLQGHLDTFNGLFNAIWSPLGVGNWHGLSPYLGAGVGFSHISQEVTGVAGTSLASSFSDDDTDFAANGIVGVDFAVMPQLTVGARYRLLFVNTSSNDSGVSSGDFIGHVITANATWHF